MKKLGYINQHGQGMCNPKLAGYSCKGDCIGVTDNTICNYWRDAFKKLSEYESICESPEELRNLLNKSKNTP